MISKVFILHHTHVDLGYTGDRGKVCNDLVEMVDQSTALIDQTRSRAAPERFRWIHEVSWPVIEHLRRGGCSEKLFEQIRAGLAELTALYVNPTDLFDYDTLCISTDRAVELARKNDLALETAMFSDCPGIAWSIVDILAERGVKYLSAAPDFIMSMPLDVERPFYWEGPKGGRLLVWFTDWRNCWYAEGLFTLRLHEDPAGATERLLDYIAKLQDEGYRWSGLAVHVAMDNEGPLPQLCDFVKYFNSVQSNVQAAMATNRDFFHYMEARHGAEFAVRREAWPDWWANGNASAAYEVACSRRAKAALRRARAIASAFDVPLDTEHYERATESLFIFDEHTWGASTSVSAPWSHASRKQWLEKRLFATDALMRARELEQETARALTNDNTLTIINAFDCEFAGPVEIPFHESLALRDVETGAVYAGQPAPSEPGKMVCVVRVPPRTSRAFECAQCEISSPDRPFDNDHFRIVFDPATGAVAEVIDKAAGGVICTAAEFGFAEVIHECVRKGDRTSMYDISKGATNPESKRPRPGFFRTAGHAGNRRLVQASGAVFDSLVTEGSLPGVRFQREIRLYHQIPRVDVLLTLNKQVVTTYESLYLAFPFESPEPEVFIENAGAVYRAGTEQLPGSATDWNSIGEYLAVCNGERSIVLVPHDVPLVQLGDINTGKWQRNLELRNGHVYSWLMNNMWFTNFPAWQEGEVKLAWSLTVQNGEFDEAAASVFAQTSRTGVSIRSDAGNSSIVW